MILYRIPKKYVIVSYRRNILTLYFEELYLDIFILLYILNLKILIYPIPYPLFITGPKPPESIAGLDKVEVDNTLQFKESYDGSSNIAGLRMPNSSHINFKANKCLSNACPVIV